MGYLTPHLEPTASLAGSGISSACSAAGRSERK